MKKLLISIIAILVFHLNGISQAISIEAFSDFSNDPDFPAFNEEMILEIKGDTITGYAFIANKENLKETIIMVHGLPGNDNQFDIAQSIRRTGRNVIHFNYRGSWGSQGDFLYSNSLDDVNEVIKYLLIPENSKRLRIDTSAFVLLGRSYGGGIALIQGSKNEKVNKIIAVSSMNAGSENHPIQDLSKLPRWKKYLNKQVMLNVNPADFMHEIFANKKNYNVLSHRDLIKKKKVLLIEDTQNNKSWIDLLENVDCKMIESDHNFISNRIELTNVLIEWLNNNK